jgi:hypothetical protein
MKKAIRILFKIPATPFLILFWAFYILSALILVFFEWVYEANEYDKRITRSMMTGTLRSIKKWFTTI